MLLAAAAVTRQQANTHLRWLGGGFSRLMPASFSIKPTLICESGRERGAVRESERAGHKDDLLPSSRSLCKAAKLPRANSTLIDILERHAGQRYIQTPRP